MTRSLLMFAAALCCLAAAPAKTHVQRKPPVAAKTHVPPKTPAGPDFLKRNGAAKGVVTKRSGLEYFVVKAGTKTGRHPTAGDTVTLDYELTLPTGEVVDSSYARGEPLTGQAGDFVPGFTEALTLMRPGDEWIVWIPPQLGYGAENKGPIPGNSVLRFKLALHSVTPAGSQVPPPLSAGILLFRQRDGGPEVLLIKPGGPYWRNKDAGAWMIPKGAVEAGEVPAEAALREFEEETGTKLSAVPLPLATVRQAGGKMVQAFAVEGDLDVVAITSNDFELEWPPRSGRIEKFPEVAEARWMSLAEARAMMLPSQLPMLDAIEAKLKG